MRIAALLRANGWALNLVFIAIGAYFVAGAVNAVLARSIRVVPTAEDRVGAVSPRAFAPARESFASIAERNLFGVKREVMAPAGATPGEPALVSGIDYRPEDLKPCTIQANIRATLVADGAREWSMAVLFVNNENTVFTINEGSNRIADDAVLVDVLDRAVVVRRRDHFERCNADAEGQPTGLVAMAPTPAPAVSEPAAGGVTRVSDTQFNVDRAEVDRALNNMSEVATQARIVPSFKNGKANGFKLFSIKPGSIYSKIGLQNGDVIQKINGYEINSPDKALEMYQKLKDASSVQLDIQRRGQSMNFSYNIGG